MQKQELSRLLFAAYFEMQLRIFNLAQIKEGLFLPEVFCEHAHTVPCDLYDNTPLHIHKK